MFSISKENKSLYRLFAVILVLLMVFSSFGTLVKTVAAEEEPTNGTTEKVLLDRGSTWKYLDNGSNQGTAWKEANFDDSNWKSGAAPLGYPEGEEHGDFGDIATTIEYGSDSQNKHATAYFRTTFEVEDLSNINSTGVINAGIDDSAILYLNGQEIARFNLPADQEIPFDAYVEDYGLNDASESSNKTFQLTEEQMGYIVEGTNVLAVEVHQDRPSSSDVFFDMELQSIYVDPSIYQASDISFAPGADETKYNFSWYSPKTDVPGVIEYAKVTAGNNSEFPTENVQSVTATLAEASSGYQANEATITGIEGSSEYVYRLGDGNGKWSEIYSFKTQATDSYNFLFMGDPQIGSSGNIAKDTTGWINTVNKAIELYPNTSFIQSAGDQVNDSKSEEEYAGWFAPELLKNYPTATTIGNHDNSQYYEYHFNTPNQNPALGNSNDAGGDYYFTYGDTLVMNLNSNNKNATQHAQFMEETVAANPNAKWKFVVFHHSIYSAASHSLEAGIIKLREELVPTIDKLDVDAVLMGHDHSYVRTYQMKNLQPLKNQMIDEDGSVINPDGTLYLTANSSSGSKYYNLKDPEFYSANRSQLRTPTFTNVEVTPTSLEFTTHRTDTMEVTDTYKIVKDPSIEVVLPALESVSIEASSNVVPTEPTTFYPEVSLNVTGKNVNGGVYDIAYEDITYKTSPEGQLSISQDGKITVEEGAKPGYIQVWAEVTNEGKIIETEKVTIQIVEHAEQTLLEKGSIWKYLDNGTDQGTAWREPAFDDSNWASGAAPLGYPVSEDRPMFGDIATVISYGPDSSKKIPTYYFRTTFEVEDLSKIGDVGHINFGIDDSVILYLNGQEIGRHNLPDGEIGYDKYLSDLTGSSVADESNYETFTLDAADLAHLVEGTNVLTAEVHQDRPTSSDIYWDMEFIASVNKEASEEAIVPEKTYDYKGYHTGKLMVHDKSVSITVDAASNIKNGVVFTGEYAEFHGDGFEDTVVTIKPKKAGTIIDFKGTVMSKVIIEGNKVSEIRGAENIQDIEYVKSADPEAINFID